MDTLQEIRSNGIENSKSAKATKAKTEKETQEVMIGVLGILWHNGGGTFEELLTAADGDRTALRRGLTKLRTLDCVTTVIGENGQQDHKLRDFEARRKALTFDQLVKQVMEEDEDRTTFKDWIQAILVFRLNRPSLAGLPIVEGKPNHLSFRRLPIDRHDGKAPDDWVWLSADYFRALWRASARVTGGLTKEQRSVFFNDHATYEDTTVDPIYLEEITCIAPPQKSHGQAKGSGFTYHEALKIGTEISTGLYYPSSVFKVSGKENAPIETLRTILSSGGKMVGFSPAKHKLGWGRFDVIGVIER